MSTRSEWTLDEICDNPPDYCDLSDAYITILQERDEAQKLAAWLFHNYVEIGGLPKDQIRAMRKRYPYLKEFKGFYPEIEEEPRV